MLHQDLSNFSYNLSFEYVAIFIFMIMLIYMLIEKLVMLKRSKIVLSIIIFSIIATIIDISSANTINKIIAGNISTEYIWVINRLKTTYILILFFTVHFFAVYGIHISCGFRYLMSKKIILTLFYIPIILVSGLIISNYFYPVFFDYGFDGNIIHLDMNLYLMILIHGIGIIYILGVSILIYKYRSLFERKQRLAVSIAPAILIISIIIELIMTKYLLVQLAFSLCIVIILTTFESSEDMIDEVTKLRNLSEFIRLLKKTYLNNDKSKILLFKMTNYSELRKSYDYNEFYKYSKLVSYRINDANYHKGFMYTPYSLNNGYYAFVFDDKNDFNLEDNDNIIRELYRIPACNDYYPTVERCLIELPNDFDGINDVVNFINNYRQSISFKKDFTKYSDISKNQDFIISNHLDQIIDTALKEKEFQVYYQPIYSVGNKKFVSAEALVRLVSKKYGFISPGSFIPFAEKTGRIDEIDIFVIEEVFKFVSSTVFKMLGLDYIELNLSMAEIINNNFIKKIRELMIKYNVNPDYVNMEVTESFEASELDVINDNLRKISEMGFKLSLDDYGTGYSNINRFRILPISIVKIDKSLVDESENDGIKKILHYSFNLVKSLKKETVVEGIETKEQLDRFIDFGADFIQGYYFSKPLDFDKFVEFLYNKNM